MRSVFLLPYYKLDEMGCQKKLRSLGDECRVNVEIYIE